MPYCSKNGFFALKNNLKKVYFRPDFYYETTADFCFHLRIDKNDIANLTGCTPKTAQKWINSDEPPRWLLPFLYATAGGVISCRDFSGWRLHAGMVSAPGLRYALTASQIESYTWHLDVLKQSQARVFHLEQIEAKKRAFRPRVLHFPDSKN